jgi:hypothetical protein
MGDFIMAKCKMVGKRVQRLVNDDRDIPIGTMGTIKKYNEARSFPFTIIWDNGYNKHLGTNCKRYLNDTEYFKILSENNMLESLKSYIEKNQDTFFTIALVVLLDHYLFEGALRSRLKSTVELMLDKLPGATNV